MATILQTEVLLRDELDIQMVQKIKHSQKSKNLNPGSHLCR
jgi:hypothetical protein